MMRIIISPAKQMHEDPDCVDWQQLPAFLPKTQKLLNRLKSMDMPALQTLWKCNDKLARLNVERIEHMELQRNLTPALFAYQGIQYQYMEPRAFTAQEMAYVEQHLRIVSGFYGLLRPLDGVTPYRLEMQARLSVWECADLYAFWGEDIARSLFAETDCVLNLASREYSVCVSRYLPSRARMITCVFGEEHNGRIVEKGTLCKMARGEMVRFLAENQVQDLKEVQAFDRLHYRYEPALSDERRFVFVRREDEKKQDEW